MRKRLLSALLAMAMVLTMLPMSAFAAGTVEQPEGLADYKVIAAGVATTLPEGFPTENAGSGVTETENTERVYVQLNKPVPDGYTITLTVYPANEVKGAYMSSYVAIKDNKITLDFHVIVSYGVSITTVSDNLISTVKYQVQEFTGMEIEKINIFVEGVRVID